MTDLELLYKKLARIETCVQELRTLAQPERVGVDVRETRFVEHTLQLAIQAALDVASHIVSDEKLGEPSSNHELFALLARGQWITQESVATMKAMAGFRNILVNEYDEVDAAIVRKILEEHLGDLLAFAGAIRTGLVKATATPAR